MKRENIFALSLVLLFSCSTNHEEIKGKENKNS
jgi:hypothetical protein